MAVRELDRGLARWSQCQLGGARMTPVCPSDTDTCTGHPRKRTAAFGLDLSGCFTCVGPIDRARFGACVLLSVTSLLHETVGEPIGLMSSEWWRAEEVLRSGWQVSEGASGDNPGPFSVHSKVPAVISTDRRKPNLRICVGPIGRSHFGVLHRPVAQRSISPRPWRRYAVVYDRR